jgi:hypothetical protein
VICWVALIATGEGVEEAIAEAKKKKKKSNGNSLEKRGL